MKLTDLPRAALEYADVLAREMGRISRELACSPQDLLGLITFAEGANRPGFFGVWDNGDRVVHRVHESIDLPSNDVGVMVLVVAAVGEEKTKPFPLFLSHDSMRNSVDANEPRFAPTPQKTLSREGNDSFDPPIKVRVVAAESDEEFTSVDVTFRLTLAPGRTADRRVIYITNESITGGEDRDKPLGGVGFLPLMVDGTVGVWPEGNINWQCDDREFTNQLVAALNRECGSWDGPSSLRLVPTQRSS